MFFCIFLIAQILICAVLLIFFVKRSQIKDQRTAAVFLALFLCASLFTADFFIPKMSICHDEIIVDAVEEKMLDSDNYEIAISGFMWGKYKMGIPKVTEGKWFFTDENVYTWRTQESDSHPSGLTSEISLSVPSGRNRALTFVKSKQGGTVSVLCCGQKTLIDTRDSSQVVLKNSGILKTAINFFFQLFITAVVMAVLLAAALSCLHIFCSADSKKRRRFVYAAIALAFLIWNIPYLSRQEFWLDEIFQIGFSGTGKSLLQTLMVTETTPPLFRLIANIWYNIMPYGEEYLLLLPTLFSAGFVYVMGLLGEETGGKHAGYIASLLAAVSPALLQSGVDEFRSNALLALLSAIGTYTYLRRNKGGKNTVGFTVCMVLLSYTHYFGVFLCGAFFIADMLGVIAKKKQLKHCIIPYIITVLFYIPWIIRFLQLGQIGAEAAWMTKPSPNAVYSLLVYLCGSQEMLLLLVTGAVAAVMGQLSQSHKNKERPYAVVLIPCIMIVCLYIYGSMIRPDATLWVSRYFLNILPCIVCLCACGIAYIGRLAATVLRKADTKILPSFKCTAYIILILILALNHIPVIASEYTPSKGQDFKGTANVIYTKPDIYDDDTLIVLVCQDYVKDGWYEYYLTMQDRRSAVNCASKADIPTNEAEAETFFERYNTIYWCYLQAETCPSFDQQLKEHYTLKEDDKTHLIRTYVRKGGENK